MMLAWRLGIWKDWIMNKLNIAILLLSIAGIFLLPKVVLADPAIDIKKIHAHSGYHLAWPQIVRLDNGDLYVFANLSKNHFGSCNSGIITVSKSTDNGSTWSTPSWSLPTYSGIPLGESLGQSVTEASAFNIGNKIVMTVLKRTYSYSDAEREDECLFDDTEDTVQRTYYVYESFDGKTWDQVKTFNTFPYGTLPSTHCKRFFQHSPGMGFHKEMY